MRETDSHIEIDNLKLLRLKVVLQAIESWGVLKFFTHGFSILA